MMVTAPYCSNKHTLRYCRHTLMALPRLCTYKVAAADLVHDEIICVFMLLIAPAGRADADAGAQSHEPQ